MHLFFLRRDWVADRVYAAGMVGEFSSEVAAISKACSTRDPRKETFHFSGTATINTRSYLKLTKCIDITDNG